MSTCKSRQRVFRQISEVIRLELAVERTYSDLTRTNAQNEELRDELNWQLSEAHSTMTKLIKEL